MLLALQGIGGILQSEFADLFDLEHMSRALLRLTLAMLLGGLLGWERQRTGKDAGLRTHMLVAVGSAFLVLFAQQAGMSSADLSRVIQGILAGMGFLGGGVIMKHVEGGRISGLTTAAGIWLTTAIGLAVGRGRLGVAIVAVCLALLILSLMTAFERWLGEPARDTVDPQSSPVEPPQPQTSESHTKPRSPGRSPRTNNGIG